MIFEIQHGLRNLVCSQTKERLRRRANVSNCRLVCAMPFTSWKESGNVDDAPRIDHSLKRGQRCYPSNSPSASRSSWDSLHAIRSPLETGRRPSNRTAARDHFICQGADPLGQSSETGMSTPWILG